jgi:hypothetical protein
MARILMFLQQPNKIADSWNGCLVLNSRHLEHIPKKGLEVGHGIGKVDGIVDIPDHRLVCRNCDADSGCDMVWTAMTQDLDELFSVSD